ncbi:MAG: hypothetical protein ACK40S_02945 [Burkholderiaceae bacterium]
MTRDEFEALAKQAGLAKHGLGWTAWESQLERFAELVARHEREACAALCDRIKVITPEYQLDQHYNQASSHCAQAIRQRGRK